MLGSDGVTAPPTVEVGAESLPATHEVDLTIGRHIGRYVVIDEIGSGGMGRVYRAYDPKLRREVALKRLRMAGGASPAARTRMLREAQSMAQLSHPNVVPVYDVDVDDGSLFIAMEFVDGDTLRGWLDHDQRSWQDIVGVFLEAGEGLLAAHRQGIVHRDFKPANVIVGRDGRTRVMDFGLARTQTGLPSSSPQLDEEVQARALEASASLGADDLEDLTGHDTVVGTPAYMAPEQHVGRPTDARSDQFAFCVALWEAVYEQRPYKGRDLRDLSNAKHRSPPRAPAGTRVPASVHAVLVRGLAPDPKDRWPDMAGLLEALRRLHSRRKPWPMVGVAGALLTLGGGIVWSQHTDSPCAGGEAEIGAVWSDAAKAEVHEGLRQSGVGFAESTVQRVDAALHAYAEAFTTMHREACEATRVRHEQSDEALDLRMACLSSRLDELATTVSLLSAANEEVAQKAVELATGLTPIARCADLPALRSKTPPPTDEETARQVEGVLEALSRAGIALKAGRHAEALKATEATLQSAEQLDYEPLLAQAELAHGEALWAVGQHRPARQRLESAMKTALRLSMTSVAAEAAVTLTGLIDAQQGRAAEARWLAHVGLALAEGDGTDPALTAEAMTRVGDLIAQEERMLDAEPYFRGAVEHVEAQLGPEHPSLVSLLSSWSSLLQVLDRHEQAQAVLERARELSVRVFGPDHPSTGSVLRQQAWLWMSAEQYARAEAAFEEGLAIYEAALGPEHPSTVSFLGTMAGAQAEQGRYEEAAQSILQAQQRIGPGLAQDHPMRASLWHNLATVRMMQGRYDEAIEHYRSAIEIRRRLGMKNDLAAALSKQAEALIELQRLDEARAALEEAEAIDLERFAETGMRSVLPPLQLGKLARLRGDGQAARQHLEIAWIFSAQDGSASQRAEAGLLLGQTLWELGLDRERARKLVTQAEEIAAGSTADGTQALAEQAQRWLAEHR